MAVNNSGRDTSIDILRSFGLLLLMLAHVGAPFDLMQVRSFDVPLMVFISGLTTSGKAFPGYGRYLLKRSKRLLIPVWAFLSIYLSILAITKALNLIPPDYLTPRIVLESFLLLQGIGYVWIIRVFLLIMLATPLLCHINSGIKKERVFFIVVIGIMVFNELLLFIFENVVKANPINFVVREYVVYLLGYSTIFLMGLRLRFSAPKLRVRYSVVYFAMFAIVTLLYLHYNVLPINISGYKYPPHAYYIIYGLFCCCLLWGLQKMFSKMDNRICRFIGKNTIWIYLWHIPIVTFCNAMFDMWYVRYIICVTVSLSMFALQYFISVRYLKNYKFSKYLVG